MSDDLIRCPCCEGEGYFYGDEMPPSPWGDADELARLRAEVERLTDALADERAHADALAGALTLIDEHCQNEGYGNPIVDNRIVDRCEETAREALAQHRARRQG